MPHVTAIHLILYYITAPIFHLGKRRHGKENLPELQSQENPGDASTRSKPPHNTYLVFLIFDIFWFSTQACNILINTFKKINSKREAQPHFSSHHSNISHKTAPPTGLNAKSKSSAGELSPYFLSRQGTSPLIPEQLPDRKSAELSPWPTSTFWFLWTFPGAQLPRNAALIRVSCGRITLISKPTTLVKEKPSMNGWAAWSNPHQPKKKWVQGEGQAMWNRTTSSLERTTIVSLCRALHWAT